MKKLIPYLIALIVVLGAVAGTVSFVDKEEPQLQGFDNSQSIPYDLEHAVNQIRNTYGDNVSIDAKDKTLRKFGRNTAVAGSYETVWRTGGNETYLATNTIAYLVSSDNGDTQNVVVEGHTINDYNQLTFVTQTATLNGQSTTTLTTPLRDITRLYNASTTDFAGTVYAYTGGAVTGGVPQTAANIHMSVVDGNQSEKAATSFSNEDYYIATGAQCFVFTKTAETVEFTGEFRQLTPDGANAFRRIYNTVASNDSAYTERFDPPFIIPKNSDVRMRAKSDGTSVDVGCSFNGYIAKVVN